MFLSGFAIVGFAVSIALWYALSATVYALAKGFGGSGRLDAAKAAVAWPLVISAAGSACIVLILALLFVGATVLPRLSDAVIMAALVSALSIYVVSSGWTFVAMCLTVSVAHRFESVWRAVFTVIAAMVLVFAMLLVMLIALQVIVNIQR